MYLTSFFFESNFDCKIPKGQKCKSLYKIKNMVAQGVFDIDNLEKVETSKRCCIICYRQAKAIQSVAVVNKSPKETKNRSLSKLVKVVQNYKCQRSN
ncbi:Uncharacterised protein [Orientia tsutsugamushi str. Gilliam]|uniref:Conjugative transfer protein n=1 Tax=Orientia tsutsugamushi str. Gilliam TaxID=1359184 RepID=A0A2U3R8H9_ORITS|nr:conjugal transfer protein [Orientia tsutsugamushi]SPR09491.1 Uncharacterised protein [Orientia tsutsugamushi str. Gilliam]